MSTRFLHLLASAATLLSACAPLGELRPASWMLPGRSMEVGAGVVHVFPRQWAEEPPSNTGMVWYSAEATRLVNLSVVSAFDTKALALGAALRFNVFRFDRFAAGAELQVGYAWAALVFPVATRLVDQTWIYASPRFGTIGRDLSFGAPVGLSVRVWNGLSTRGEVQASWQDLKSYNRRVHSAFGIAWQPP
jgi:hypothetical protein